MRSVSIAEWILRRVTSGPQATSIVGDLIEAELHQGVGRFWLSVAEVLLSQTWRLLVALVIAIYAGNWAMGGLGRMVLPPLHSPHRAPEAWIPALELLSGVGAALWCIAMYAAIRYGLRDKVTQITLASAGFVTIVVCYWWQPIIRTACLCVGIVMVVISMWSQERRKAALTMVVSVTTGLVSYFVLVMVLATLYMRHVAGILVGDQELRGHPSVGYVGFFLWCGTVFMTTKACSMMHQWLMSEKQSQSDIEEGFIA